MSASLLVPLAGPTFTNGGIVVLVVLSLVMVAGFLAAQPPRYRCSICRADFTRFTEMTDHELTHLPRQWCACRTGGVHHPACPQRTASERRAS